jgi:tetratricopeptide (TPR) repeat protein
LARDPDNETAARVLLSLAHAEFELNSHGAALDLCRQALDLPGIAKNTRGLIYSQLGLLYMRAGEGPSAMEKFDEAIPLLDDESHLATAYLNRGNVHVQRGDVALALHDFDAAIRLSRAIGDRVQEAKAEHNLGCADLLAGDLVGALEHLDAARPVLSEMSPAYRAVCEQDRAEVLMAAGMVEDAEEALREAAAAFGSRRLRQRQAEAELTLARSLLRHEPMDACRVARKASRRFAGRGSEAWALRADAVALAATSLAAGRTDGVSRGEVDELEGQLRELALTRDAQIVALQGARVAMREGDIADASRRVRRARVTNTSALPTRLFMYELRSELALATGRRHEGERAVRRGLAELHEWQSSFGSLDLQSSLVGHGRSLAMRGLSLAVDDGRPQVVFEWAERARALASRVAPVRPPADELSARDLAELRRVQSQIRTAEDKGRVPSALRKRAEELKLGIRQRAWHDKGSGTVTESESLDAVQQRLRADEALVGVLAVDGQLTALAVTHTAAEVVPLGPLKPVRQLLDGMLADLDMAAAHLPAPMRQAVHGGLGQRLVQLSSLLVGPWARHVRDRRVVVVPSGALAGTPWTLLPDLAGRPVTVPRSASEWVNARDTRSRVRSAGFVAGPRVDRAHEEVKRAAQAWRSADVLVGEDVRAEPVGQLASQVDVFHVAAHGRHSADNPLFSGLELADGPWFGYDIDQVRSIPSTVILSACELGRSTIRWGEESIGMTVAWLHAGARCVIASPAMVDDDVACEVLAATHQQLAAGAQPADALAEAMAAVDQGVAPFICFGSGW